MTPAQQKAESLIGNLRDNSYVDSQGYNRKYTIENAIVLCKEVIKTLNSISKYATDESFEKKKEFWQQVKQELIKMK